MGSPSWGVLRTTGHNAARSRVGAAGSFCLLAACAAGWGPGTFPAEQPSVLPPSLQVKSGVSPGGHLPRGLRGVCAHP